MNYLCENPEKARRNRQRVKQHQNIQGYVEAEQALTGFALDQALPPELAGELPISGMPKHNEGFCQPFREGE